MIITIDGPSGTGKSTVARKLAERLSFVYFDTGAMYRALTWFFIECNVDIHNTAQIASTLAAFHFAIREENGEKKYFVNDQEVTEIIRTRLVTSRSSEVSALPLVRSFLLHIQHDFGKKQNAIFEGRDLGSVVFPHADLKVFLDADPKVRAERRLAELVSKGAQDVDADTLLKEMTRRDAYDSSREVAPLKCPEHAFKVDTTHLGIDEVVEVIVAHYKGMTA